MDSFQNLSQNVIKELIRRSLLEMKQKNLNFNNLINETQSKIIHFYHTFKRYKMKMNVEKHTNMSSELNLIKLNMSNLMKDLKHCWEILDLQIPRIINAKWNIAYKLNRRIFTEKYSKKYFENNIIHESIFIC